MIKDKVLLAITTAGMGKWMIQACESLNGQIKTKDYELDVVIIDDCSLGRDWSDIRDYCKLRGFKVIHKTQIQGLTDSWNRAYRLFRDSNVYKYCIISNDDVIFAKGFARGLIWAIKEGYDLVGPMTDQPGIVMEQWSGKYVEDDPNSTDLSIIQSNLKRCGDYIPLQELNGFCFAFGNSILKYEVSDLFLFEPENIMIANDRQLCRKINEMSSNKMCAVYSSYVKHFKGRTCRLEDRNLLWPEIRRRLTSIGFNYYD